MTAKRGRILNTAGLQRIATARRDWEKNYGTRCTLDQLVELSHLSRTTVSRILRGTQAVDLGSIQQVFTALDLEFDPSYAQQTSTPSKQDWGEAIDCSRFVGREEEIQTICGWILRDRCRIITIVGMGGIGKTSLSIKVGERIQDCFDVVIWRSLRSSPDFDVFFIDILTQITGEPHGKLSDLEADIIKALKTRRVLLILDNIDSLLDPCRPAGLFAKAYGRYSELVKKMASVNHSSSIVVTSRERVTDLAPWEGDDLPVRYHQVKPLSAKSSLEIFMQKKIDATEDQIQDLVIRYGGNPLCLKLVATTIYELYSGDVLSFSQQSSGLFEGVRAVLESQLSRLTPLERNLMYWIALRQEPVSIQDLAEGLIPQLSLGSLVEVLESLAKRSLIEKRVGCKFSQQSVVSEFIIDCLTREWCSEVSLESSIDLLRSHAISYSQAPDHIQCSTQKLIIQPLAKTLLNKLGRTQLLSHLHVILKLEKEGGWQGYTAANVISICHASGIDGADLDLAGHYIRLASFQRIPLANLNMKGCKFYKCKFAQHCSQILGLTWHPSGDLIAIVGGEGEVMLWHIEEEYLEVLDWKHQSHTWEVSFTRNGGLMATASSDKTARVWSTPFGREYKTLSHPNKVYDVKFSPDDRSLVTACADGVIRVWQSWSGEKLIDVQGHDGAIYCIQFLDDGTLLASGGEDGKVHLWDPQELCVVKTLEHEDRIWSMAASDHLLACGCWDGYIYFWTLEGEPVKKIAAHKDIVLSVSFNDDGSLLASASRDKSMALWDVETSRCQWSRDHEDWVRQIAFSPNGRSLVSGGDDQTVKIWNTEKGICTKLMKGYTNGIANIQVQGDLLVTGSADQLVRLWRIEADSRSLRYLGMFGSSHTSGEAFAISHCGGKIAANTHSGVIQIWDHEQEMILTQLIGHREYVTALAFDDEGKTLASADNCGWIRLWNSSNGTCYWEARFHQAWVWTLIYNPIEAVFCSAGDDGVIRIWDREGTQVQVLEGHRNPVTGLSINLNGDLVSCSFDQTVRVWDISSGESTILRGSQDILWTLAMGKRGEVFAAGADRFIHCWIAGEYCSWEAHDSAINKLVRVDDVLLSASVDETIKIWDIESRELIHLQRMPRLYENLVLCNAEGLTPYALANLQKLGAII